mmetsp:Transcript_32832/g.32056  ORF Transcript_32832/g.32056 Transcript_32832/m.32056 type:complete len:210 (-) Transcript_32832:46-675(-)
MLVVVVGVFGQGDVFHGGGLQGLRRVQRLEGQRLHIHQPIHQHPIVKVDAGGVVVFGAVGDALADGDHHRHLRQRVLQRRQHKVCEPKLNVHLVGEVVDHIDGHAVAVHQHHRPVLDVLQGDQGLVEGSVHRVPQVVPGVVPLHKRYIRDPTEAIRKVIEEAIDLHAIEEGVGVVDHGGLLGLVQPLLVLPLLLEQLRMRHIVLGGKAE